VTSAAFDAEVTFTEAVRRLPAGQAAELRAVYRKPAAS